MERYFENSEILVYPQISDEDCKVDNLVHCKQFVQVKCILQMSQDFFGQKFLSAWVDTKLLGSIPD